MKKNNRGRVHFGVLLLTTQVTILLLFMVLEIKLIMHHRDNISDGILLSNLAACTVDAVEFVDSMPVEKKNGIYDIRRMAENARIHIDEKKALTEFQRLLQSNRNLYGQVCEIIEFTVYNVSSEKISIYTYSNNNWSLNVMDGGEVLSANGIQINKTSVYAKLSTKRNGFLLKNLEVCVENCVQLEINEDLQ